MTAVNELVEATQEQTLESIRRAQQLTVEAISSWNKTTEAYRPSVPGSETLIDPRDAVKGAFDFAEQLLATQRSFVESVLSAALPAPAKATPKAPVSK